MTEIVFKHGGTLDKYVGDAVMVFFGDPIPQDDHAERAVSMALEMLERMRSLEDHWYRRYDQVFEIGIGIATGWVTVGDIGSRSFRLHRAGQPGEPGVATRRQGERAPDPRDRADDGRGRTPVDGRLVDEIELKGISRPIKVYEVVPKAAHDQRDTRALRPGTIPPVEPP